MSTSELLMRFRNIRDGVMGYLEIPRTSPVGTCYCLGGVRHRDGMNLILAFVRNVGTCRLDVKGEIQVEIPQESEYRCEAQGRSIP